VATCYLKVANIRTVIRYERDGFVEGTDLEFKNKLLVRETDEVYPSAFSTIVKGQDERAIYSNTTRFDLDPEVIRSLSAKLRSTYQSLPEINPESNLGSSAPNEDDLESSNMNNNKYTSSDGRKRKTENDFWVKKDIYGGEDDWNSSWSGVKTPEFYKGLVGDGFNSSHVGKLMSWTSELDEELIEQIQDSSYNMFQNVSEAISGIAEEKNIDPLDVFETFYKGNLSHEHDYYLLLGGNGGSETMTLTDPSKEMLWDSIGFFEPSVVKHLHDGEEDSYFEDEIEKLRNEGKISQTITNDSCTTKGDLVKHLQESEGLESVNGVLTIKNSSEELKETIEHELNKNE